MLENPNPYLLGFTSQNIDQLSGDDAGIKRRILSILNEEYPLEREQYNAYKESKDSLGAFILVSKLKHKLGLLGLDKAYDGATSHANALREGSWVHMDDFDRILQALEQSILSLK
ncbi:MAG: Hpt domain-containing protein [Flavobacteriaceae bacterium]